ncbi:Rossmann fold nucleotide-binding protein Smf involved in DNA uptake [Serinicoccus hydrothermalis]|uniref:Rossmann fold nucleotide-binding protein Smf involved in DNA uptake n=1 Tax=Serinicoccus hydrothermalis TaxID=1758689 RepID=A0A1B1NGY2_9MICO|nr:Rossmann fold nucleotide-binding protein Smf involved in DNA uptake [Serinicoccus hydrothermalis]
MTTGGERRARVLLSRLAEPYDERVQQVVAEHGVEALVGYVLRDGRIPGGPDLHRLGARVERATAVDDAEVARLVGARVLVPQDPEWPACLDDLEHPPWCLWVAGPGRLDEVVRRSVAVVGARASTAYGDHVTAGLCVDLVGRGFTIVSGAAFGIDAAAHRAALASDGCTVAVLAGGVDVAYPRANAELIDRIRRTGLVVSETPPGGAPARMRFLARNRIIAGLAQGTVVVEAGLRSGARSTLKHARELGRHVMAVPGSVDSLMSQGAHAEIRMGAELVTDGAEVAELVGHIGADLAPVKRGAQRAGDDLPDELRRVWQWLRPRSSSGVDEVMLRCGLTLAETLGALRSLEREGLAEELLDGWQRRPVGSR